MVKQISIFAENKPGRLEKITRLLADNGVNILATTIASADDFGIVKLLVDHPDQAHVVLKEAGVPASLVDIVAVYLEDRPGGLHEVVRLLAESDINVEDAYGFVVAAGQSAVFVFEVRDVSRATDLLASHGIPVVSEDALFGSGKG